VGHRYYYYNILTFEDAYCCHCYIIRQILTKVAIGIGSDIMLGSWHKKNNIPFITSPAVDEERMKPDHWLMSVLYFLFSSLMLMDGWQEECLACKTQVCQMASEFVF